MMTKEQVAETYQHIQDEICRALEEADGAGRFEEDLWTRDGGGGGRTRILQNGAVIEKGGVNFSAVHGTLPETVKKALGVQEDQFFATGVSIVLHPNHPLVPIIHMNIRYFELNEKVRWFGGGIDLTPHYVVAEQARFFHRSLKAVCDEYAGDWYSRFKTWADDYFYIPHRQETRGIGGIFFDKLNPESTSLDWETLFAFSQSVGRAFAGIYTELMQMNRNLPFTEAQKKWQFQRRSRYVEFNLVNDSGTRFGLETNGRTESILMSLPPQANWVYQFHPELGSDEEATLNWLKKGIDWVGAGD